MLFSHMFHWISLGFFKFLLGRPNRPMASTFDGWMPVMAGSWTSVWAWKSIAINACRGGFSFKGRWCFPSRMSWDDWWFDNIWYDSQQPKHVWDGLKSPDGEVHFVLLIPLTPRFARVCWWSSEVGCLKLLMFAVSRMILTFKTVTFHVFTYFVCRVAETMCNTKTIRRFPVNHPSTLGNQWFCTFGSFGIRRTIPGAPG